jgi:uncharacterized coiled-coil protein SlyX
MQIQMTPELLSALTERLKREYAETATANFALDILADGQAARIKCLTERVEALQVRVKEQDATIAQLQEQLAPGRPQNRKARG